MGHPNPNIWILFNLKIWHHMVIAAGWYQPSCEAAVSGAYVLPDPFSLPLAQLLKAAGGYCVSSYNWSLRRWPGP